MYHCRLHLYFIGESCREFEIIKGIAPFERFTHTFSESKQPEADLTAQADVIFVHLSASEMLQLLIDSRKKEAQLIVLAEKPQALGLTEVLPEITDLWILPMSDAEIRFRFSRWQQTYQMRMDYWQTSQYLETTINSIPNLIWYKDKEGIHQKVNDSFCKTVNKTKEQVEGRDHYYIWNVDKNDPANKGKDCMESDNEVIRSRKTLVTEETVQTGNGIKLMETYKSPLYDLDGSVVGTVGVGIDVTQERAYKQELVKKNHVLEAIFAAIDCGILCHTVDGSHIISVNRTALRILGYESEERLTAEFDMISESVLDEDKPKLRKAIQILKKVGDSASIEYRVRHDNGEILHIMGNIKLLQENGEMFYQRFLLDCTEQKLQEKENERRQIELVQALSIDYSLVFFFDLNTGKGFPLRADDSSSIFDSGYNESISFQESMARYVQQVVYEEDKDMLRQIFSVDRLREELSKKRIFYVNYRAFIEGKVKYYEMKVVRAGTWHKNHGIVLGFRCVDEAIRNEMEQKKLLEDALVQANRASKAKTLFLSNMSHDIRTPMNAIMGFTNLAVSHIDNKDRVQEYLNKIMTSGHHLLCLLNDVLDMSQIESGKMQMEETFCSLPEILHDLHHMIQSDLCAKQLEFHVESVNINHETFYCDKLRLNQVLLNILNNSIKYTNAGGKIQLIITEKSGTAGGCVDYTFCIKDNGIGMNKDFVSHIFESFARERNTTNSGIQGTGLGMAITKNIVDMMHGSIVVESEQNVGTEVTVSLKFHLGSDITENVLSEIVSLKSETEPVQSGRILLVEDNELNQEIAAEILHDAGFEVEIAENGKTAVNMIKKSHPGFYQVVLMDIQMPVMNGYEAAKSIRALPEKELASIPILAMTANAFEEDRKAALKSGMNGHIAKPIDVGMLISTLNEILGRV